MSPGGLWLYATLMLVERRSGSVIILVLHMTGWGGVTGGIKSGGAFFFAWTLLALGVTAVFSVILSVHGLRSLQRGQPR